VVIGTTINAIYLFAVLPRITTLEALIVALMPVFVLVSWLTARPATARFGYLLSIFVPVQLALDSSYAANFASFANSSIALMFGVAVTGAVSAIARFSGAGWIANRLLRSNWRTLASIAERKSPQDFVAVASLMQHRLALLAARIAVVPAAA